MHEVAFRTRSLERRRGLRHERASIRGVRIPLGRDDQELDDGRAFDPDRVDQTPKLGTVEEWTIDQLAQRSGVPARTVREYQTLGLVHPPRRSGRIGLYDASHLRRLALIARLQERGYYV